jgi:hypothetical protein
VKPDLQLAIIYLYDGAVIKGRRAGILTKLLFISSLINFLNSSVPTEHKTYYLMLPDVGKFEARLREAESQLGIRVGTEVPVIIERNQEFAWLLLLSLAALAVMLLWMFRSGTVS